MSVLISDCITDILTPLDIPKPFGRQCEEFLIWFANCQIGKLADRVQPRQQSCQTLTSHPDLFQTSRWLQFKTGTVISHLDDDQESNLQLNYPLLSIKTFINYSLWFSALFSVSKCLLSYYLFNSTFFLKSISLPLLSVRKNPEASCPALTKPNPPLTS